MILSDRGVDEYHVPIPSLLAVSAPAPASGQDKKRERSRHDLRVRRAERGTSFCNTVGYGACAINPYLAQDTVKTVSG